MKETQYEVLFFYQTPDGAIRSAGARYGDRATADQAADLIEAALLTEPPGEPSRCLSSLGGEWATGWLIRFGGIRRVTTEMKDLCGPGPLYPARMLLIVSETDQPDEDDGAIIAPPPSEEGSAG